MFLVGLLLLFLTTHNDTEVSFTDDYGGFIYDE